MNDQQNNYSVKIPVGEKIPNGFEAKLGRINIILGRNGSGKSSILEALKEKEHAASFKKSSIIYIEGGRTLPILESLAPTANTSLFSLDAIHAQYDSKTKDNLSTRIGIALRLLERKGVRLYEEHSNIAESYSRLGKVPPLREDVPLEKLFSIFSDIFTEIKIGYDSKDQKIKCKKNDSKPYSPKALSDGEKQIFCLIAELLLLVDDDSLILVDEPELNLQPALAIDFWRKIETHLPNAVFIYATHLINFCVRPNVDTLIVLSQNGKGPLLIRDPEHPEEIQEDELRAFLGTIPSMLTGSQIVVIEGKDDSVDRVLYPWLLKDTKANFAPVGSCRDVKAAVMRDGVWKALGAELKIIGIVDSDFKTVEKIQNMKDSKIFTLPLHEIESILILPKVVCLVAERLGLASQAPSESQVEEIIIKEWEGVYPAVALKRVCEEIKMSVAPSVSKKEMADANGDAQVLSDALIKSSRTEKRRVFSLLKAKNLSYRFECELKKCKDTLDQKDIAAILTLMPAKQVMNKLFSLVKCKNPEEMARAVCKHVAVDEVVEIAAFRKELIAKLEL